MLVKKTVGLRTSIELAFQGGPCHMHLTRAQLRNEQKCGPTASAKPPRAVRRGAVPTQSLVPGDNLKALLCQPDPRDKRGTMGTLAPTAMAMGEE